MKPFFKFLFSIVVSLLSSQTIFAQWQGAGTEQNPFKIYTIEDLENITVYQYDGNFAQYIPRTNYPYGYDTLSYAGIHFEIMNNIDAPLTQILCKFFYGYLHGKGHSIALDFNLNNNQYDNGTICEYLYGTVDSITFVGHMTHGAALFTCIMETGKISHIISNLNCISIVDYGVVIWQNVIIFSTENRGIIEYCVNNSDISIVHTGNLPNYTAVWLFTGMNNEGKIKHCVNNGSINISANVLSNVMIGIYCWRNCDTISNCINNGNINIGGEPASISVACFAETNVPHAWAYNHKRGVISNCINTGNVYAERASTIGIFATDNRSTISNCLNVGRVVCNTFAGGIAGKINFAYSNDDINSVIENCLNMGEIIAHSAAGGIFADMINWYNPLYTNIVPCVIRNNIDLSRTSGYALFGKYATEINTHPEWFDIQNNFYDKQMVTVPATPDGNISGKAEGKLTTELTGFALQNVLGNGWSYAENRYPIPLGLENYPVALLAAAPVYLHYNDTENFNTVDSVTEYFSVGLENNVEWGSYYNKVFLYEENAFLQYLGYENLIANLDNYSKNIYINIMSIPEQIEIYTISGNVSIDDTPLENVKILYSSIFVTTDQNGNYSFNVPANANVTITPILAGYKFLPANIVLQNITQDYANQNFTATLIEDGIILPVLNEILIYPNPVKDELKIKNYELRIMNVEITDLAGKIVYNFVPLFKSSLIIHNSINVSHLPQGVYFVKIYTDKGIKIEKIVKK